MLPGAPDLRGHPSCKDTKEACIAHVDQELDASVIATDIEAACTDYISQK